jgi:5,10-methylenetetrahydromethanopterin reductase
MMDFSRIGVRVHGGMPAVRCIALAEAAEANGFSSLWFAENPFNRGVMPAVAGAVLATKRLKIGLGVVNPYNRHPTLIAMEIAALDELAGGRAALGIGSGIGERVMRMGLSYDKPLGAMRDAIAITKGMLRGDAVTYAGAVFSVHGAKLEFPAPRPDMPIYMAAMGEQALRLCGQIADGLMISNLCPPGFAGHARTIMAEGAAKAGREPPQTIIQYVPCIVSEDRVAARRQVRTTLGEMLSAYSALYDRWPATKAAIIRDSGIAEEEFPIAIARIKAGEAPADVLDERYVDAYAIAGNTDDWLAGVQRFMRAGVSELVLTFVSSDPQRDMALLAPFLKAQR